MDSRTFIFHTKQNHAIRTYRHGQGGPVGIRKKDGEYSFRIWCRGAMRKEDLPPSARPVKLEVFAWSWGETFATGWNEVTRGKHLVGAVVGPESWIVLYEGRPREA